MRVGIWAVALCVVLAAAGYWVTTKKAPDSASASGNVGAALVDIQLPASLSSNAQIGQNAFASKCAACHGENAVGQDGVAPPLVHIIYEPSHHGDESFQRAVAQNGARRHDPALERRGKCGFLIEARTHIGTSHLTLVQGSQACHDRMRSFTILVPDFCQNTDSGRSGENSS